MDTPTAPMRSATGRAAGVRRTLAPNPWRRVTSVLTHILEWLLAFLLVAVATELFWRTIEPLAILVMMLLGAMGTCAAGSTLLAGKTSRHRLLGAQRVRRLARTELLIAALMCAPSAGLYANDPLAEVLSLVVLPGLGLLFAYIHFYLAPSVIWHVENEENPVHRRRAREERDPTLSEVAVHLTIVAAIFVVVATGWAVAADRLDFARPSDIADVFGVGGEAEHSVREQASDEERKPPDLEPHLEQVSPVGTPLVESGHIATPSGESCYAETTEHLHSFEKDSVGQAMARAWRVIGQSEIGCAEHGIKEMNGVFFVRLTGGQSDPSLIVSDADGRAAVVFEELVPQVRRLMHRGKLENVSIRRSVGFGDYQLIVIRGDRCRLAGRHFGGDYVVLPATATTLVVNAATATESFPSLVGYVSVGARDRYSVKFHGAVSQRLRTLVVGPSGDAWFRGDPGQRVTRMDDLCPGTAKMDAMGRSLRARLEGRS